MRELEGKMDYIGGGEESYGFLPEDFVRDKDAVSSCALMPKSRPGPKTRASRFTNCCSIFT
jgi:hypothetical protein